MGFRQSCINIFYKKNWIEKVPINNAASNKGGHYIDFNFATVELWLLFRVAFKAHLLKPSLQVSFAIECFFLLLLCQFLFFSSQTVYAQPHPLERLCISFARLSCPWERLQTIKTAVAWPRCTTLSWQGATLPAVRPCCTTGQSWGRGMRMAGMSVIR